MATLTKLGIRRSQLHGSPSPVTEKNYENEIVYPELNASGKLAEQLGAEELKVGEVFTQTVKWKVKRVSVTEENGKKTSSLDLCMVAASNIESTESDEEEDEEQGESEDASAAMDYIQGRAQKA